MSIWKTINQQFSRQSLQKKAEELGIKVEVNQDKIDKMVIQPKDTPELTTEAEPTTEAK